MRKKSRADRPLRFRGKGRGRHFQGKELERRYGHPLPPKKKEETEGMFPFPSRAKGEKEEGQREGGAGASLGAGGKSSIFKKGKEKKGRERGETQVALSLPWKKEGDFFLLAGRKSKTRGRKRKTERSMTPPSAGGKKGKKGRPFFISYGSQTKGGGGKGRSR